jgi:hypothetical protein
MSSLGLASQPGRGPGEQPASVTSTSERELPCSSYFASFGALSYSTC